MSKCHMTILNQKIVKEENDPDVKRLETTFSKFGIPIEKIDLKLKQMQEEVKNCNFILLLNQVNF